MPQYCAQIFATIRAVPQGKVCSYGQIADLAGLPGRARLVGTCLRRMSSSGNVPWHRIVRSNGVIAFPKGSQEGVKQSELLQLEGIPVIRYRVDMKVFSWQPDLSEILQTLSF